MKYHGMGRLLALVAVLLLQTLAARAQYVTCPAPIDLATQRLPEIVSDRGVVRGTITLADGQTAFLIGQNADGSPKCVAQLLRFYQSGEPVAGSTQVRAPLPGPTLRAQLGDVVELTFLNQIDPLDYGNSIDRWENAGTSQPGAGCDTSTSGYPDLGKKPDGSEMIDSMPNCFHGSSTGNIHFHGTHTNPNATGDNIFIGVRPSPRDANGPLITTASVQQDFATFFADCERRLKANPLLEWPKVWTDLPAHWRQYQQFLLQGNDQGKPPASQLWPVDAAQIAAGEWPQYYIGSFPTCFTVPTGTTLGMRMGQAPGTHWYHAHKHGSVSMNVSNGMAGALIIEGPAYDGVLNAYYNKYRKDTSADWTRQQPVMVVNQLAVTPALERGAGGDPPKFSINGYQQPILTMRTGEVQLWRIVNASSDAGFYLPGAPDGFQWRQIAQDGVQFDDQSYQAHIGRPIFVAPGNRIDLLVQAPAFAVHGDYADRPVSVVEEVSVSNAQKADATTKTLLTIRIASVAEAQVPLIEHMPARPAFLRDITDAEVANTNKRTITFETVGYPNQRDHLINGHKFSEGQPISIDHLNTVEEWTIVNRTASPQPRIDHPFHIHVNPFQVTEVFDPSAPLLDPRGQPVKGPDGKNLPLYVVSRTRPPPMRGQCWLNPDNPHTWVPCKLLAQISDNAPPEKTKIWWDVFPIPAGLNFTEAGHDPVLIPGYFKLRSRFVDYPGSYVIHCHILTHEDRGMMVQVNLATKQKVAMQHH